MGRKHLCQVAPLWGLLPGKRGESRYRVIGRDAPEWAPGDPGSLRESLRAQEGPQKLSTGQQQGHRD